jgi:hypothetical protein
MMHVFNSSSSMSERFSWFQTLYEFKEIELLVKDGDVNYPEDEKVDKKGMEIEFE